VCVYLSSVIGILYPLFYKTYIIVPGHEKAIAREFGGEVFFRVPVSQGKQQ